MIGVLCLYATSFGLWLWLFSFVVLTRANSQHRFKSCHVPINCKCSQSFVLLLSSLIIFATNERSQLGLNIILHPIDTTINIEWGKCYYYIVCGRILHFAKFVPGRGEQTIIRHFRSWVAKIKSSRQRRGAKMPKGASTSAKWKLWLHQHQTAWPS